jgi:hypothetical protein
VNVRWPQQELGLVAETELRRRVVDFHEQSSVPMRLSGGIGKQVNRGAIGSLDIFKNGPPIGCLSSQQLRRQQTFRRVAPLHDQHRGVDFFVQRGNLGVGAGIEQQSLASRVRIADSGQGDAALGDQLGELGRDSLAAASCAGSCRARSRATRPQALRKGRGTRRFSLGVAQKRP